MMKLLNAKTSETTRAEQKYEYLFKRWISTSINEKELQDDIIILQNSLNESKMRNNELNDRLDKMKEDVRKLENEKKILCQQWSQKNGENMLLKVENEAMEKKLERVTAHKDDVIKEMNSGMKELKLKLEKVQIDLIIKEDIIMRGAHKEELNNALKKLEIERCINDEIIQILKDKELDIEYLKEECNNYAKRAKLETENRLKKGYTLILRDKEEEIKHALKERDNSKEKELSLHNQLSASIYAQREEKLKREKQEEELKYALHVLHNKENEINNLLEERKAFQNEISALVARKDAEIRYLRERETSVHKIISNNKGGQVAAAQRGPHLPAGPNANPLDLCPQSKEVIKIHEEYEQERCLNPPELHKDIMAPQLPANPALQGIGAAAICGQVAAAGNPVPAQLAPQLPHGAPTFPQGIPEASSSGQLAAADSPVPAQRAPHLPAVPNASPSLQGIGEESGAGQVAAAVNPVPAQRAPQAGMRTFRRMRRNEEREKEKGKKEEREESSFRHEEEEEDARRIKPRC